MADDTIEARYEAERAKRLRAEGNAQYQRLEGRFADFDRDRFLPEPTPRAPVRKEVDVAIIGAGLGGLLGGAYLSKAGVTDLCILDRAGDFGGTWYWNRYPGVACDVESYVYMPLLEETGYIPTQRYASGPEIFEHCRRVARHYGLADKALFATTVTEVRWQADQHRWLVSTDRGDAILARFLITAGGIFSRPKLPGTPGIERFQGHAFHSSRWDYDYTGGSPTEPMDRLATKKVALIGTGCTAIQIFPKLAAAAEQVYLVQRTPSAVNVRANRPTPADWEGSLQPGWQQARVAAFTHIVSSTPVESDMIGDGWTEIFLRHRDPYHLQGEASVAIDREMMDELRARITDTVTDEATATRLQPWFNLLCKRPTFHDEYLPTFNRDNVTLLDTDGKGIERITETGIVVNGEEHAVDCIIYASGFDLALTYAQRMGFEIYGRDGISLSDAWADGPATLFGMHARGFPNLLMFSLTQGGAAINFTHILSAVAEHAAAVVAQALAENMIEIEPSEAAQEEWLQALIATANPGMGAFLAACTPGYYNGEGASARPASAFRHASYGGGTMGYIDILEKWRAQGDFAGLEILK